MVEVKEVSILGCYQSIRCKMLEDSSDVSNPAGRTSDLAELTILKFFFLWRSVKVITLHIRRCKILSTDEGIIIIIL
jgi:hypothetical protein